MNKEYQSSKRAKIFAKIGITAYVIVVLTLLAKPLVSEAETSTAAIIISIFITIFFTAVMIDILKAKFYITEEYVYHKSLFADQKLSLTDIKGFRENKRLITIEANTTQKKTIQIRTTFENSDEIVQWLSARYPNLDRQKS